MSKIGVNVNGKVAIVTGATRGIGRTITENLLARGCKVIGVFLDSDDKARELIGQYPDVTMIKKDLADKNIGQIVVQKAISKYGKLDFLINNAGIFLGGEIVDFTQEDWDKIIAVNVTAKYLLIKSAIPYLEKSENPVIVNIASRFGLTDYVQPWCIAYGVTNASIINLTLGLALELKDKCIRVNAVIPTVTNTDRFYNSFSKTEQDEIIAKGKLGTTEDVWRMVLEATTDKAKNGEITVDKRVHIQSKA